MGLRSIMLKHVRVSVFGHFEAEIAPNTKVWFVASLNFLETFNERKVPSSAGVVGQLKTVLQ